MLANMQTGKYLMVKKGFPKYQHRCPNGGIPVGNRTVSLLDLTTVPVASIIARGSSSAPRPWSSALAAPFTCRRPWRTDQLVYRRSPPRGFASGFLLMRFKRCAPGRRSWQWAPFLHASWWGPRVMPVALAAGDGNLTHWVCPRLCLPGRN